MAHTFYEFFAGGGMARIGLGPEWRCAFANDIDEKKAAAYRNNFGESKLVVGDVGSLSIEQLPGTADLAWASFPCQDLSLAGSYAGLKGNRSGTFFPFWNLVQHLKNHGRQPRTVVLENVVGALTSHGGKDFAVIGSALADAGYRFGAIVVDAVRFVPQSRPRLFVIGVSSELAIPKSIHRSTESAQWHSEALLGAYRRLPDAAAAQWVWWDMPIPPKRNSTFADLIEANPQGVDWHTDEETQYILSLMSSVNLAKVQEAKNAGIKMIGGVYRRTRPDASSGKRQRAEVRFDDVSGCLRTPVGGSSRQTIVLVEGEKVQSRLLSPREGARLMGLPDEYKLPARYNEAYHLVGDGVVVPVVRHIAEYILKPIMRTTSAERAAA